MTESELARMFESGEIADDPDRSVEFETVEEWLAIAEVVFRKKRLRELIAIKNAKVPEENPITINRGRD